jgi:hypothetical protein
MRHALAAWIVLACVPAVASGQAQQQRSPAESLESPRAGNRANLERQVQQMLWRLTRQRVGLTEAQMRQLVPVNRRFEVRRRQILREERELRLSLRRAVLDSTAVDSTGVDGQIERLLQLQRQRVDLLQEEQRELARFMTPRQRVRYMALQEQVRRRVEQLRRRDLR